MDMTTYLHEKRQEAPKPAALSGLSCINAEFLLQKEFAPLMEPVGGLIVEGLTLLVGASKIGKSWLALSMCCAVAEGKVFLGRSTQRGDVLYLALEDSQRRIKSRLETLHEQPGANLTFSTTAHPLDGGLLDDLREWVRQAKTPRLIVIDTLQKVRGNAISARSNAYAADYECIGTLKRFADENHIAIVLVHHLNKSKDVSDKYDKISGSTGLMGAADTAILVTRERNSTDATIAYTGRDVDGEDFNIRMEDGKWKAISPEAMEREMYESDPIVRLCRDLMRHCMGNQVRISLRAFKDAGAERLGAVVAATKNDLNRKLAALASQLERYDGITVTLGKRIGSERGIYLTKAGAANGSK